MNARSAGRALLDEMGGIERGAALERLAMEKLLRLAPDEAARALSELSQATPGEGHEHHHRVLAALCAALLGDEPQAGEGGRLLRRNILDAALALGLWPVVALLTEAPPDPRGEAGDGRDAEGPKKKRARDQHLPPLGRRTQRARVETEPDRLARLCADDEPSVIRNLLLNPRLTEALVLRVASRRPAPAALLLEVARSRRWNVRRSVQRALCLNPYAAPSLACSLLPLLMTADLREVAASPVLHPSVSEAARTFLCARGDEPPLGEPASPTHLVDHFELPPEE